MPKTPHKGTLLLLQNTLERDGSEADDQANADRRHVAAQARGAGARSVSAGAVVTVVTGTREGQRRREERGEREEGRRRDRLHVHARHRNTGDTLQPPVEDSGPSVGRAGCAGGRPTPLASSRSGGMPRPPPSSAAPPSPVPPSPGPPLPPS